MKKFNTYFFLPLLAILFLTNCNTQKKVTQEIAQEKKPVLQEVILTCEMTGCNNNALALFQFDGLRFQQLQFVAADSNNVFTFKVPMSEHQFYFLGTNPRQTKPIILGTEKNLTLQGNCSNIRKSVFVNSPINSQYETAINQIRGYQGTANYLNKEYARSPIGSEKKATQLQKLKENDIAQLTLLNDMRVKYPFIGKIVATKTYLSYPNNKGNYENEVAYYLDAVFAHLDLQDPDLNRMPALYETFRDYTNTLIAVGMDQPTIKKKLDSILGKMNTDGDAYRFAVGAIMQSLKSKNHPAFVDYANIFVEKYEDKKSSDLANLKKSIADAENFMIGAVAPDFEQNTPEGDAMKLSDLRGKVVLVDFWASWCGPCRKENPNVVRLYNKYKAEGFEVLGISLDKTKDKWLRAIEKDGLTWQHVSDLRGWSNKVAKQYSVSSIPHTILLDKEGRILARNMRGVNLERKLKEIFGK